MSEPGPSRARSRSPSPPPTSTSPTHPTIALPNVAAGPIDPDHPNNGQGSDALGRRVSVSNRSPRSPHSHFPRLTLVRSTDTHPPHHAHFDISEGDATPQRSHELHEPHHRDHNHDHGHSMGTGNDGKKKGVVDIEHVPVDDDPREWSDRKKNFVLMLLTISVLGPLIAPSIYNPVIDDVMRDLSASQTEIGLSISLYILFQGCIPVLWASVAEIVGRKIVYIVSYAIYLVGAIVASRATNMPLFIAMRCFQACGSSAVVAVGAGSLADMFDMHERGQKLGIFYGMPLVGPAIGPLIGGALGNAFGWRSALYFLAVYAGICFVLFLFFPDTWRRERSRVYQKAMERAVRRAILHDEAKEKKRARKAARGLASNAPTPPTTGMPTPERRSSFVEPVSQAVDVDVEKAAGTGAGTGAGKRKSPFSRLGINFGSSGASGDEDEEKIQPGWRDVNPFPTMWSIFHQPTNAVVLFASGILFAAQYTIVYTAAITLAKEPYAYNALHIGLVLLSFGVGNMAGSLGGGKYSDVVLRRLKEKNGGVGVPEMRLKAVIPAIPFLVGSFLAYAWTADKTVHISAIVITLLFGGCSIMIIYAGTLAYLVDSNPGRSAGAVSCNSFVRGSLACVLSQVAIPIQNGIGDGGLYTIFSALLALSGSCLILLSYKGEMWRSDEHKWPWQKGGGKEKGNGNEDEKSVEQSEAESRR